MDRRQFLTRAAAAIAATPSASGLAAVPEPYYWNASPPRESREAFVEWMARRRGEEPHFLGQRWDRFQQLVANLTPNVWSIEIIHALATHTRALYDSLIARGYSEYSAIRTRNADGYYGWEDAAPFDKVIVTCGIDHIPPPLLQQMKPEGIMVIPVGPPGAQHVKKAVKRRSADGRMFVVRSDIYGGAIIPFVPFTGLHAS